MNSRSVVERIAIQGEWGSNSHLAALQVGGDAVEILPCAVSAEVFEALAAGKAARAVLPIENSLHGSVAEHYDLMLAFAARIVGETQLRIRHNVIVAPGVGLDRIRRVISHPVALSQCRLWLRAHRTIEAVPFYDTAGAVKHLMAEGSRDTAAIAAGLAAQVYAAEVLQAGIEDHAENYTRFLTLVVSPDSTLLSRRVGVESGSPESLPPQTVPAEPNPAEQQPDKLSVVFALEHRPGSLIEALQVIAAAGLNLTKIESRPVPGKPWEYLFFVDARYAMEAHADSAMEGLQVRCTMLREMGRYRTADAGSP